MFFYDNNQQDPKPFEIIGLPNLQLDSNKTQFPNTLRFLSVLQLIQAFGIGFHVGYYDGYYYQIFYVHCILKGILTDSALRALLKLSILEFVASFRSSSLRITFPQRN